MKAAQTTDWLDTLPIRLQNGTFHIQTPPGADPIQPFTTTFEQHINSALPPQRQIRRRSPEIRRALANHLRHEHHPQISTQGPWIPQDDRYTPFRSVLNPLLAHAIWSNHQVIAAPCTLYLPRPLVAGHADAIIRHADGSIGVVIIHTGPRDDSRVQAAQAELGGCIAALIDHRIAYPTHAITIWAAADHAEAEYHHPDGCLCLWCDAVDLVRFVAKLRSRPFPDVPAAAHPPADQERPR